MLKNTTLIQTKHTCIKLNLTKIQFDSYLWKKSALILHHKIVVQPIHVTSNSACNMLLIMQFSPPFCQFPNIMF